VYAKIIRPLAFLLSAELSHKLIIRMLRAIYLVPGIGILVRLVMAGRVKNLGVKVMDMDFPNPVGLAAGLDKNGTCARAFSDIGFGFIELGTVTPKSQKGNSGKRIFRLESDHAIINRMGFPSVGVNRFLLNLRLFGKRGIVGINIGKNASTPLSRANDDYLTAMRAVYPHAHYIAVNISSPNTTGLRDMQSGDNLDSLLSELKSEQIIQTQTRRHYVPLAIKIAPDLSNEEIKSIAEIVLKHKIDAVIATNTTVTRPGLDDSVYATENGGLSGRPLKNMSTDVIRKLYNHLQGKVPIIGAGGIENSSDVWDKMVAGADLVQIYTGLIYEGPGLIRRINRGLERRMRSAGHASLQEMINEARSGVRLMR
jgi:dihydroorotate dehydrogenase